MSALITLPPSHPTRRAKWSFALRRVDRTHCMSLLPNAERAQRGDLILAEVTRIGSHKRLQLADGRFSPLWPGDRIVVACADRFAVDQFDGQAKVTDEGADLLAGGGICGTITSKHEKLPRGTRLAVIGRLANAKGAPINVADYALPAVEPARPPLVVGMLGTGMNSGKTSAAAGLINGFTRLGHRVAAIKATGTGSFGDVHEYEAAGAQSVLDFTDAGLASTRCETTDTLMAATDLLLSHAAECDIAVVELADGVSQVETASLLSRPDFVSRLDATVLAAPDAMAAQGGLAWLAALGISPLALSGVLTRAPLSVAELTHSTGLPVLCRDTLADPATAAALKEAITGAKSKRAAA